MLVNVCAIELPVELLKPVNVPPVGGVSTPAVHVNVVPDTVEPKVTLLVAALQIVCGAAEPTGIGLTVTVAVAGVPAHPLADELMVNVTVTGEVVVLVSVPPISDVPLEAMPVTVPVLSLVQL